MNSKWLEQCWRAWVGIENSGNRKSLGMMERPRLDSGGGSFGVGVGMGIAVDKDSG